MKLAIFSQIPQFSQSTSCSLTIVFYIVRHANNDGRPINDTVVLGIERRECVADDNYSLAIALQNFQFREVSQAQTAELAGLKEDLCL